MAKAVNHAKRDHALLSPSGAKRWLACTKSAHFEQRFPDNSGDAAKEGTLAHELSEFMLRYQTGKITKSKFNKAVERIQKHKLYKPEMMGYCEDYASYVLEKFSTAQTEAPDAMLYLEQELDLSAFIPESFGTSDINIVSEPWLRVVDLKYGKGVPVDAFENEQMMVYALGALDKFLHVLDIKFVEMTIYQPRLDNISTWVISVEDLLRWAETVLKPKAIEAFKDEGEFVPGEHCKFCRGRAVCRALADYNIELAKLEFGYIDELTDQEISDILARTKSIQSWLTAVNEHALEQAMRNGKKWPHFKLVEGKSNRTFTNDDSVINILTGLGYDETEIIKPRALHSLTDLTTALGKRTFETTIGHLVIKPVGKPTLVPVSDNRVELNSAEAAAADFGDEEIDLSHFKQ